MIAISPRHRLFGRPKVLDLVAGQVFVESGAGDVWSLQEQKRIAVLAHFSPTPLVSRSFRTLVRELRKADYGVLVVSASDFAKRLEWVGAMPPGTVVLRKPNVGYDFGSWAVGLEFLGASASADRIILANDSLVGPFASLRPLLDRFDNTRADVWALTDTYQFSHHLQSYFLGFRSGVLDDVALQRFFRDIRHEPTKEAVIRRYEIGMSRLLFTEGYVWEAEFPAAEIVGYGENPVIRGWHQLLRQGFPFVKREIIRSPHVATAGEQVPAVVDAVYGARLSEWL